MNVNIGLFTFGTFGNPNGYKHSLSYGKKEAISVCNTFDLNTNAIKLFEGTNLFSIKKGVFNNKPSLIFSIYTHALESNSNREGTFIGCSMICVDVSMEVPRVMKILFEYLTKLKELNTNNSRILVKHSDEFNLPNYRVSDLINRNTLSKIPKLDSSTNDSKLLIFCEINNLKQLWNDSIFLLNKYSEIFFTQSTDISNYVNQKGLYKIIQHSDNQPQLLTELENIKIEKNKNHQQNISSLENRRASALSKIKEIQSSLTSTLQEKEKEKNSINSDINKIQKAEAKLNEVFRNCDSDFNNLVKDFSSKQLVIDQVINKENLIQNTIQNELQSIREIIKNTQTSKRIQEHQNRTNHHSDSSSINRSKFEIHDNRDIGNNIFEMVSIILSILLIGSWVYILFFQEPEMVYRDPSNSNQLEIKNVTPNGQIPAVDVQKVNQQLMINMTIEDVINIIFELNPNDVKKHFLSKRQEYLQFLIDANPNSFKKENNSYILIVDSLGKIPSYRR